MHFLKRGFVGNHLKLFAQISHCTIVLAYFSVFRQGDDTKILNHVKGLF